MGFRGLNLDCAIAVEVFSSVEVFEVVSSVEVTVTVLVVASDDNGAYNKDDLGRAKTFNNND